MTASSTANWVSADRHDTQQKQAKEGRHADDEPQQQLRANPAADDLLDDRQHRPNLVAPLLWQRIGERIVSFTRSRRM